MAVIDELPQQAAAPQPIDIETWTEQATAAMGSVTISAPGEVVGATTVTLAIPLDDEALATGGAVQPVGAAAAAKEGGLYKRKAPLRRDSMDRREALLKGKEGSRQRRRWENGTYKLVTSPLSDISRIAHTSLIARCVDALHQIVF